MSRVLVTGGAGFVGRATVSALVAAGHEVHVAEIAETPLPGAQVHRVDLFAPEVRALLEAIRPTHLLHSAWYAIPGLYWTSIENLRWVEASVSLVRSFAAAGGQRVVVVGSCAEYDWRYGFCSEEVTPLEPATLYGVAKDSLRRVLFASSTVTGLSAAWARLFFLHGPNEAPGRLVSGVCSSLLEGTPTRVSSGSQVRDFMHIDDVGRALVEILDSSYVGAVNVGSGEPASLRTIVTELAELAGRPELARFGDLPDKPGEPALLVPDVRRLSALGFRPRYGRRDGLAATLAWWRNHMKREG